MTESSKQAVGEAAVDFIEPGMIVGLGSGSTVNWMLARLGKRVKEGLDIKGIPTSKKTEKLAKELGIPLTDFSSGVHVDLAIDGADEIDGNRNLIKGGGGSLVREKIVDAAADKFMVVADETKIVSQLGAFPLPVEVVPFGWQVTANRISKLGCTSVLRTTQDGPFVSDNGNYILDCEFESMENSKQLHAELKKLIGVVETGLFIEMATTFLTMRNGKLELIR